MIKVMTAYTLEIDERELAVEEILGQLDLEKKLLKNAVGIINCHQEFVHSKVVKALCDALPFDTVGVTTTGQAVNGKMGILTLTLMVLTSDQIEFLTTCSQPLSEELDGPLRAACLEGCSRVGERPDLILAFAPLLLQYSGDQYVELLDEASGGAPLFGTMSVEDDGSYQNCFTIYNGECQRDTFALVFLSGGIRPDFFIATLSDQNILSAPALITASDRNVIKEINGFPFLNFLEGLGVAENGKMISGHQLLLFMIDNQDGTPPVGKLLIKVDENGYGVCGGDMPKGKRLSLAVLTKKDVLKTTWETVGEARGLKDKSVFMTFSCNTRNIALGSDIYAEFETVDQIIGSGEPYLAALSGGEICPYVDENGRIYNRFHNNSFIICNF